MAGRLAFFRDPAPAASAASSAGSPPASGWGWGRKLTPGPSRTVQLNQLPEHAMEPGVTRLTQVGSDDTPAHYTATAPYPVKHPNLATFTLSSPLGFGGYFRTHWESLFGMRADLAQGTRRVPGSPNRNARGKAEGQAIMQYQPFPSAGEVWDAYPGPELKAI